MPQQIAGLDYYEVQFGADGTLVGDGGLGAALVGKKDIFVLTHGWNNSVDSARSLYNGMFTQLAPMIADRLQSSVAVGVLWPSLLFPEDDPTAPAAAAAAPAGAGAPASTGAQLAAALAPAFPDQQAQLTAMGAMLDQQPQDPDKLQEFHALASGLVTTPALASEDEGEQGAITGETSAVFGHAAAMAPTTQGAAQGFPNPFTTLWSGAREVLRTLSYYEMKNRAGVVGQNGLGPMLGRLATTAPGIRVHLVGHSFGARLVSYSLSGLPAAMTGAASPVKTLYLVQGAFSHFAFADPLPIDAGRQGALAAFANRVDGPLMSTFTAADRAVGWWYPTASMIKREDSESLTDVTYRWGGMGHDGYQQSGAANFVKLQLAAVGQPYDLQSGSFYALDANTVIKAMQSAFSGAHSDIQHPEVLWALASSALRG